MGKGCLVLLTLSFLCFYVLPMDAFARAGGEDQRVVGIAVINTPGSYSTQDRHNQRLLHHNHFHNPHPNRKAA